MRRTRLPAAVVLVVALGVLSAFAPASGPVAGAAPPSGAAPDRGGTSSPVAPAAAPGVTGAGDDVAMSELVPTLQQHFGTRFGGWWIEWRGSRPTMHVAVVQAGRADRAALSQLAGRLRVTTHAVEHGYDSLVAAADEVAATLAHGAADFAVGVDVATNAVVVETAADPATTAATARPAARRGAATEAAAAAAADIGAAVVIEPGAAIDIATGHAPPTPLAPGGGNRNSFPPFEAGLSVRIYVGSTIFGCTSGLLFRNGFGRFGSTAGHCGRVNSPVVMGPHIVDVVRANGYFGRSLIRADAALFSMSARGFSSRSVVHVQGGHRTIGSALSNAQIARGLGLCFEGMSSNGSNCGTVVRANQTLCCDAYRKSYVYSCISFAGLPGDSGGPVFQRVGTTAARAAGMLSSTVTVNGARIMCFSTAQNLQQLMGPLVIG